MNTSNKVNTPLGNLGKSLLLAAAFALVSVSGLQADFTWNGGTNGNWNLSDVNWLNDDVDTAWVNNNKVILPASGGTINITEAISHGDMTVNGTWTFTNTASVTMSGVFNLSTSGGGKLILEGPGSIGNIKNFGGVTVEVEYLSALGTNKIWLNASNSRLRYTGLSGTLAQAIQPDSGNSNGIEVVNPDTILTLAIFDGTNNTGRPLQKWGPGTLRVNGIGGLNHTMTVNEGLVELQVPQTNDLAATLNAPASVTASGTIRITGGNPADGSITTNGNQLPAGYSFTLSGTSSSVHGTLDLNGYNERIGSLMSNNAYGILTNDNSSKGSTLFVGALNTSTTYAGQVTGNLGLTKEGTGTLTLSGVTDYTGTTTASEGVLRFSNASAIALTGGVTGVGTIERTSGGDLTFSGVTAPGVITFDSDGVTPLTVVGALTFTGAGDVVFSDQTQLIIGVDAGGAITNSIGRNGEGNLSFASGGELFFVFTGGEQVDLSSNQLLTAFGLNPDQLSGFVLNSNAGLLIHDPITGIISIPEPSTYALFGAFGAVGLALLRRRKVKAKN